MKIVVDQNIPLAQEFFSDMGDVVALPGRELTANDLCDADILLVRSITQVNEALLSGSRVKFVGSCTIGTDHVDLEYLKNNHITFANAPACNANAVVQYVFSAMARVKPEWQKQTIGIVGCGNIGSRLYKRLRALDCEVFIYDPFLSSDKNSFRSDLVDIDRAHLVSFDEILGADIITCHTPLTRSGPFPTYHLFGKKELAQLSEETLLINSGRGAIIDNEALLAELNQRSLSLVLDVWENEPAINRQLLDNVALGTFHIAGYSVEGKEQGTYMVYQALCQFFNRPFSEEKAKFLSQDISTLLLSDTLSEAKRYDLNTLLLACYDITNDDQKLRQDHCFDFLRQQYVSRREYSHFQLPEITEDSYDYQTLQDQFTIIKGAC